MNKQHVIRRKPGLMIGLFGLLMVALVVGLWISHDLLLLAISLTKSLHALGLLGLVLFVFVQFFITLIGILPGSLLGLIAGVIYGITAGFITSAIGIAAGAMVAFGLSRSTMRPLILKLLGKTGKLAKLDAMIAHDSWQIVALLRISPVMPFSITSYALGLSGISTRSYIIGTLAMLPPLFGWVTIGAIGGAGFSSHHTAGTTNIHLTMLVVGAVATLALMVHFSRLLARALRTA
jgi:uncharacterized membrane protein YdjX (TVP38/TMEM64 family)